MSSHREAPEISKDPAADNTDTYAFRSPDKPGMVTMIANFNPLEDPAGGPTFFEFGDDVRYRINIDNDGDGRADIVYEFKFRTEVPNAETFLYNTGPITSLDDENYNRPQTYDVILKRKGKNPKVIAEDLRVPPCNVGPRSTPDYGDLANSAIRKVGDVRFFAGQRLDPFYIDLGAVFDLAVLRPFQNLHLFPTPAEDGVNALRKFSVHTIAVQVPISLLTRDRRRPTDPMNPKAVIGVWVSAHRQKGSFREGHIVTNSGPWTQVSRLGNPLFNELLVPMSRKDEWNALKPYEDDDFAQYVAQPELAKLLPVLYPNVFPNLAGLTADRADLLAILLTGIPKGIIPGFQNYTGPTQADMLRLNVAIPPSDSPDRNGILGGDLAGFPNGRRVFDDVATIEIRAIAGLTYPLVEPSYTPDPAAEIVTDGSFTPGTVTYLDKFPYCDHPVSGYDVLPLSERP